ncbi:glycoside hydrolase 105 family protein [Xylanibacillus composti]|uniref:Unsaturated rhamnogalacturonyl hydrolase YteR n=1 Tax=Xylanibacillus composti TaxID=1572762 RepID=A0A8J4H6F8_9BACL|nr:glycoside hydrolase family 88 protein [Xylanibacillus composti]MDT9726350.1 glycoside hydrolase 105 family protein [Xylanibacillus composti]GIQ70542.1 unsaturated rhamnogalacturonyl hydrolase YteR [Xylanibacillus composti]
MNTDQKPASPVQGQQVEGLSPLEWGMEACRALMATYQAEQLPPAGKWHYHQGVFLFSMQRIWEQTGDKEFLAYIKGYVDSLVDPQGNVICEKSELDSIQAGLLLFVLDREFADPRYKRAAEKLLALFPTFNRTSEGGFWHKDKYPYQMWLDGLYMGGAFAMSYAKQYNDPALYEMVLEQERLMRKHTKDEQTGLYYHAWDESRSMPWAEPHTGRAPEFWGRAIGWIGLALLDFLDLLPEGHQARPALIQEVQELAKAVVPYQDAHTGLWHQVVDKGDRPDNWLETSCSSLFVYTLAKGIRQGFLDHGMAGYARKGFSGLLDKLYRDAAGRLIMPDICIGTGVGDYAHYVARPRSENDLHGVGAFVLACVEMEKLEQQLD